MSISFHSPQNNVNKLFHFLHNWSNRRFCCYIIWMEWRHGPSNNERRRWEKRILQLNNNGKIFYCKIFVAVGRLSFGCFFFREVKKYNQMISLKDANEWAKDVVTSVEIQKEKQNQRALLFVIIMFNFVFYNCGVEKKGRGREVTQTRLTKYHLLFFIVRQSLRLLFIIYEECSFRLSSS